MAKVDEIGKWSEEKLELLGRYLAAYTSIMTKEKQKWLKEFAYVDALAGSVTPALKKPKKSKPYLLFPEFEEVDAETVAFIDGSPLKALKTNPPFDKYFFNDLNTARLRDKLYPLKSEYPDKEIEISQKDCNKFLMEDIIPLFPRNSYKRAFVFVDPYGLQVKWDTIQALGEAGTFDVFINFPIQGITRQLGEAQPTDIVRQLINNVMGCSDWYDKVYQPTALSLFSNGLSVRKRRRGIAEELAKIYANNLRNKKYFKHVSTPRIMRQDTNSPLYALILASQAELAIKKMNEIYKRIDLPTLKKSQKKP